ncbi:hypothetical protein ACWCQ0_46555 [Streptomyces massasporeus]
MFPYDTDCEQHCTEARDIDAVRGLDPALQDFGTWLAAHRDRPRTTGT